MALWKKPIRITQKEIKAPGTKYFLKTNPICRTIFLVRGNMEIVRALNTWPP